MAHLLIGRSNVSNFFVNEKTHSHNGWQHSTYGSIVGVLAATVLPTKKLNVCHRLPLIAETAKYTKAEEIAQPSQAWHDSADML